MPERMKSFCKTFLLLFQLIYLESNAQSWERLYGNDTRFCYGQEVENGSFISIGTDQYWANQHYLLSKVDSLGDTLWTKIISVNGFNNGDAIWGKKTLDNGFIFTGDTHANGVSTLQLVKTDNIGDTLWTNVFSNTDGNGMRTKVVELPDSSFALFGEAALRGYCIKTDQDGNLQWRKDYGYKYMYVNNAVQDITGGFYLAGYTDNFNGTFSSFILRTDANGDTLWGKSFSPWLFYGIAKNNNGGFYVCGRSGFYQSATVFLGEIDLNGILQWTHTYPFIGGAGYVEQTNNGDVIMTGTKVTTGSNYDSLLFIKTTSTGSLLWYRTFADTSNYCGGIRGQQTSDGGYFIVGNSGQQGYLIKLDSLGNVSTGITQNSKIQNSIFIFPNPSSGIFQITLPSSNTNQKTNYTLEVINTLGQTVFERHERGTPLPFWEGLGVGLDLSFLPKGMYVLKINDGENSFSKKLIIQ
jgi:hypothetical protein